MSFASRAKPSTDFEATIIARLQSIGWHAFPFGQAQLPDCCRDRLARFRDTFLRPSLIRWMPDIIAFSDRPDGAAAVALIDAKVCGDRPNYAIETAAIEAAELYADRFYTPAFFVFDDWKVLGPREARLRGRQGPEPAPGSGGSGTPYVLVTKRYGVPFAQVFPQVAAARPTVVDPPLAVVEW